LLGQCPVLAHLNLWDNRKIRLCRLAREVHCMVTKETAGPTYK
jgi:hypothetical protein